MSKRSSGPGKTMSDPIAAGLCLGILSRRCNWFFQWEGYTNALFADGSKFVENLNAFDAAICSIRPKHLLAKLIHNLRTDIDIIKFPKYERITNDYVYKSNDNKVNSKYIDTYIMKTDAILDNLHAKMHNIFELMKIECEKIFKLTKYNISKYCDAYELGYRIDSLEHPELVDRHRREVLLQWIIQSIDAKSFVAIEPILLNYFRSKADSIRIGSIITPAINAYINKLNIDANIGSELSRFNGVYPGNAAEIVESIVNKMCQNIDSYIRYIYPLRAGRVQHDSCVKKTANYDRDEWLFRQYTNKKNKPTYTELRDKLDMVIKNIKKNKYWVKLKTGQGIAQAIGRYKKNYQP